MKKVESGIYCIENIQTGMQYIGKGENVELRMWKDHKGSRYIYNAIKKYTDDGFKRFIVEYCEIKKLVEREKYYIKEWNTKSPFGYNLTEGGEGLSNPSYETREIMRKNRIGTHLSDETKELIRIHQPNRLGNNNPMFEKHHSLETIESISRSMSGQNNPFYNKHHSDNTRKIMRENHVNKSGEKSVLFGAHPSDETKKLMREHHPNTSGKNHPRYGEKLSGKSSQYFGVYLSNKKYNYWSTRIKEDGVFIHIGTYKTELDAAIAYDKYVIEHNLNRPLNFPRLIKA